MQTDVSPLLVSTSDINGGAARAAYRIHEGLHQIGVQITSITWHIIVTSGHRDVVQNSSAGSPTSVNQVSHYYG